ncbi:HNH endonuclease [Priestia megaterium]|nr:HNH endonuclease [Priestia megaterium]MCM3195758.1 HNH endonuclease [Priestia megaterium]
MILVEEEIHAQFSHSGGVSVVKQRHEFPEIQEKGEN